MTSLQRCEVSTWTRCTHVRFQLHCDVATKLQFSCDANVALLWPHGCLWKFVGRYSATLQQPIIELLQFWCAVAWEWGTQSQATISRSYAVCYTAYDLEIVACDWIPHSSRLHIKIATTQYVVTMPHIYQYKANGRNILAMVRSQDPPPSLHHHWHKNPVSE